MGDKQLKEKMEKYVASTANEQSEDMKKYKSQEKKSLYGTNVFRLVFVLTALVFVVGVAVGIVIIASPKQTMDANVSGSLSAYLPTDSSLQSASDSEIVYDYIYEIDLIKIGSIDELNQKFEAGYLKPKENIVPLELHLFKAKDRDFYLGVKLYYKDFDYNYNNLTFSATLNKYNIQFMSEYDVCDVITNWGDTELHYKKIYNSDDEIYTVKIVFTSGDYDYYLTVTVYEDFTPQEILDFLF